MTTHTSLFRFIIVGIALSLLFVGLTVHADGVAQVTIASNGQVMVRGAEVISVAGSTLTVSTVWGSTRMTWIVNTSGSTRFVPNSGSAETVGMIKIGDSVSFSGSLDMSSSRPTVTATVLKDLALIKDSTIIGGTVLKRDLKKNTITVGTDEGTTTVAIGLGTIMTLDGNTIGLAAITEGDPIKVSGSLNLVDNKLYAERVSLVSAKAAQSAPAQQGGFFATILHWFRGNQGTALSVR